MNVLELDHIVHFPNIKFRDKRKLSSNRDIEKYPRYVVDMLPYKGASWKLSIGIDIKDKKKQERYRDNNGVDDSNIMRPRNGRRIEHEQLQPNSKWLSESYSELPKILVKTRT
ncbi:hypothetical protein OUZ56_012097 [Daphnia magna]|uniref:Uncharacterized protein n=1 Tax=Daphnia magna TaxID=35525 RepID=A0ABQ9Z217_9CRUS|nr:hypothetical protein OUZ56_012097 [Daphnia magna]